MIQVLASLALIAMGIFVDAYYQHRIRIAECNAYETGHEDGKREERLRLEEYPRKGPVEWPSMAPAVALPDSFEERLRKHGRATARIK